MQPLKIILYCLPVRCIYRKKLLVILTLFLFSFFGSVLQFYRFEHSRKVAWSSLFNYSCELPTEAMVMSLDYWEQSGSALASLYNLQCWASSVGIKNVVEPEVVPGSGHTFHFSEFSGTSFKDYFDIDEWNKRSVEHGHSKLVTWKYFFKYCFKDMVYVQILFPPENCKSVEKISRLRLFKNFGFKIRTVCVPVNIPNTALTEKIVGTGVRPQHCRKKKFTQNLCFVDTIHLIVLEFSPLTYQGYL